MSSSNTIKHLGFVNASGNITHKPIGHSTPPLDFLVANFYSAYDIVRQAATSSIEDRKLESLENYLMFFNYVALESYLYASPHHGRVVLYDNSMILMCRLKCRKNYISIEKRQVPSHNSPLAIIDTNPIVEYLRMPYVWYGRLPYSLLERSVESYSEKPGPLIAHRLFLDLHDQTRGSSNRTDTSWVFGSLEPKFCLKSTQFGKSPGVMEDLIDMKLAWLKH